MRAKTSSISGLRPTMPSKRQVFNSSPSSCRARWRWRCSAIRASHALPQAGDGKRLGEIVAGALANGFHGGFGGIVPGDEDHFGGGRGGENPLQDADAVNARHDQVQQHDLGALARAPAPTRRRGRWRSGWSDRRGERASWISSRLLGSSSIASSVTPRFTGVVHGYSPFRDERNNSSTLLATWQY